MNEFKDKARQLFLQENNYEAKEYDVPLDLPGAYKALKQYINKPIIVHNKKPDQNYMKPTFSTNRHAVAGKIGEE